MTSVQEEVSAKLVGVKTIEDSDYNVILEGNALKFQTNGNVFPMTYDGNSVSLGNVLISPDSMVVPTLTINGSIEVPDLAIDHFYLSNVETSDHHQIYLPRNGNRSMVGNLNMGGHRVAGLGNAVADTDAITRVQLNTDPRFTRANCIVVSVNP